MLSYLPSNDVVRLRGVSRGLRDAVHRIPGGLFVKLSISLPDTVSSQRCGRISKAGIDKPPGRMKHAWGNRFLPVLANEQAETDI